jgi:hypothetical protein
VALLAAALYLLFTVAALALHSGDPLWFMWMGERYAELDPAGRTGYDGQFVYYLARDGAAAIPRLDNPPYRLQRILLPVALRLLSFGRPQAMPWALIAMNLAAVAATAGVLAGWLRGQGLSPGYGLLYPLYVGTLMAYSRNLIEPLAFLLAAAGAVAWLRNRRGWAVALLALAALAKETALLFPMALAAAEAAGLLRGPRPALRTTALRVAPLISAALPALAWALVLRAHFGVWPTAAGPHIGQVPLAGILSQLTLEPGRISALLVVALPALALAALAIALLWRHPASPTLWLLLLHGAFVALMPPEVYDHLMHAGRNSGGLVVAATLALPALPPAARRVLVAWCVLPTLAWVGPILRWAPWLSQV